MQHQPPPGHSYAGLSIPVLGGVLHRVTRDSDGCELLARSPGSECPSEAAIQHLDAELSAAAVDDRRAILRASGRIDAHRQSWLLYEGVVGQPLDMAKPCELPEFWDIAQALTRALAWGHSRGRTHGRLESNCIWWDPKERRVGLLGMLPSAEAHLANFLPATVDTAPELLVAEHAKVSPSADVYSLGAIFYRLLSGRPALESNGNLAFDAAANPPARLGPDRVPEGLADLLARMLSKSPASRPQDATAVLDELDAIRAGATSARPSIGVRQDSVIGRTSELERLLEHARAVEAQGSVIVRLSGEPGVGKSHLLAEFMRRMASSSRLVADGKFEQFHRGRPYGALLTAFGNALGHALAADEPVFTHTKQRLREADPALLGVLAPDIPEISHLCGELPEAHETGPSENQTRFKRAFAELLSKLSAPEAPLVLVLDDLQWGDRATADLIAELFEAELPEHLVLVLAYREPAASQNADLADLFKVLGKTPLIRVGSFDLAEIESLCRAAVPDCEGVDALASITYHRSHGNALHAVELLKNFVANGELSYAAGRWRYAAAGNSLKELSETVAELIRDRLSLEAPATRRLLAAAACVGHEFSDQILAVAMGEPPSALGEPLQVATRRGFLVSSPRGGEHAFCHDRIQQVVLELSDEATRGDVYLRLGRHYREQIAGDRSALFRCLEYLNRVSHVLDEHERPQLWALCLEGARRARATIAYERAIPLVRLYLQNTFASPEERFEATLLLTECLLLSAAGSQTAADRTRNEAAARQAQVECAALAASRAQKLKLLHSRLLSFVHDQDYQGAVEVGLSALRLLERPLPSRPSLPRVIANLVSLSAEMKRKDLDVLVRQPDRASDEDLEVLRFLVALWGPSHWVNPHLNALVCVRLMEMTLRCGNGKHSSMAYGCYAAICHMQEHYEVAIRYGRLATLLAKEHSPYTRTIVRFLTLTFFGVFEQPPREVLQKYDDAIKEVVAHGEIIASHLIDGAVTTLPHLGPDVPHVLQALRRYEREARAMGVKTSLEIIGLVRCWCEALAEGPADPNTDSNRQRALHAPVEHASYSGSRDMLRMQIEYLWGRDDEVLRLAGEMRKNVLLKGNPLHKASYALFVVLAATRGRGKLTRVARQALKFLQRLDGVQIDGGRGPGTFRSSLRLGQGVDALARGDVAGAIALLEEAAASAAEKGQGLVHAMCLERLAHAHGALGQYALFVERLRDAGRSFRRFGASAKADAIVHEYPGIDWTHLRPRAAGDVGIQVEGIMRAASTIVEATSKNELGPTLLRVIATAVGAMRALLFTLSEGKLLVVAECERDRANQFVIPTPVEQLDPKTLALKPIRRVERSREIVQLPNDLTKFVDDPYLTGSVAPRGLLCVPLLYHGDLVAILYLENSSNGETFSRDDVTLVTLLGKQAAIAMTNADNHRLEIDALQSKVNPHFLYNALSVIAELVGRSPEEAEEAVYKLTRLYRYMVSSSSDQRVPLEKELAVVRDYLELERARFGNRLNVKWDIDDRATSFQVPALLVQPLAENAVNHGIRRNVNGGTVAVSASIQGDVLAITVSDDGPGWYEGRGGTGFGLKSVRRRLQLMYGTGGGLRVVKQNGVAVHVTIPI